MRCVVSVLGQDRSGIVAAIAGVLSEKGTNIVDISQTLLQGIFSMTMLVDVDPEKGDFNEVQKALEEAGKELGVQVIIQREDVFHFMYKI